MLRVAVFLTIFCFLAVSVFGTNCGWLCISTCEAIECPEIDEPTEAACASGCSSGPAPVETPSPTSRPCGQPDFSSCCSPEPTCAALPCSQDIIPECKMKCTRECIPDESDCGKCIMPHLDFTLAENKSHTPKMELVTAPSLSGKVENSCQFLSINDSRSQGIHPTISSTVLRL
jgi:hypothetical protein